MPRNAQKLPEHSVYLLRATLSDFEARERGRAYRLLAVYPETSLYDLAYEVTDAFGFDFDHAFGFYDNLHNPYQSEARYELFVDLEAEEAQGTEPTDELAAAIMDAFEVLDADALQIRIRQAVSEVLQDELLLHIPAALQDGARERLPALLEAMIEDAVPDLSETFDESEEEDWGEAEALGVREVTVAEAFDRVGKKLLYLFDYGDEWRFVVKFMRAEEAEPGVAYPRLVESVGEAPEQYPAFGEEEGGA